jgi:hypothetical protein
MVDVAEMADMFPTAFCPVTEHRPIKTDDPTNFSRR